MNIAKAKSISSLHPLRKSIFAVLTTCCLLLAFTMPTLAATATISDRASVLDDAQIQKKVDELANPVKIFTMNDFKGSASAFQKTAEKEIKSKNQIVIAIETRMQQIAMVSGKDVKLSQSELKSAINTLENSYEANQNYTTATLAALDKLPKKSSTSWLTILIVAAIIGLIIAVIAYSMSKARKRHSYAPHHQYAHQYPHHSHHHNHYHDSDHNGINPLVAGGIGAAAGGMIGYAIGNQMANNENNPENLIGASVSEDIDNEDFNFGGEAAGDYSEGFGGFGGDDFGGGDFGGGDFGGE